ncbi:MAG TPA: prolyl oligopeptidase family serine peptidase [Longimicrobiales bacterium]|nr:prolyl oligopeptidase family serine peptidase [Longimicrobiales bacterium]
MPRRPLPFAALRPAADPSTGKAAAFALLVAFGLLAALAVPAAAQAAAQATAQEGRPFTPEDALDVASISVQDVTPDGRWIAATIRTRRDGMNVDHFRFGDPTYVSPSTAEFVLIDTEAGGQDPILDGRVQVRGVAWSPDGDELAFFLRGEEGFKLHLFDLDTREVRYVGLATDLSVASNSRLEWRPAGDGLLLDLRAEGWAEEARAAFLEMTEGPILVQDGSDPFLDWDRVRMMSGLVRPAIVTTDGEVDVLLPEGYWEGIIQSEDGQWLTIEGEKPLKTVYEGGGGSENRLLRMELQSGDTAYVVEPTEDNISANWAPDGTRYVFEEDDHILLRSIFEDSAQVLTEAFAGQVSESDTTSLEFDAVRWRPDGEALLVETQRGWHLLDLEANDLELFHPISEEEREDGPRRNVIDWSEDGRYLYVAESSRDEWRRGIAMADLETGRWYTSVVDRNTLGGWTLAEDGSRLIFEMSDGDTPEEVYVLDADLSETSLADARALTDLNPWLDDVALTRSELVEYLDVDGETRYGILYYPIDYREGERYPLVAEIYEDFFDNGFNTNMNLITSRGWFGFRPSVEFETGFPGEAWLKAVTTGINDLIERGMVDGDRLGVHGTSYGGYAVNLLVTQTDRFAAAVNISGKVNMISFLGDSEKITTRNYRAAERGQDRIGATLWEQPQKYIEHSAVMFADRIETPLLLLSGEGDWNVPATNQREMYYALRRLGKDVVWVNYMNAGHGAGRAGGEADWFDHWNRMFDWYETHFEEAIEDRPITEEGAGQR